jgi:small subunit ribosomal protein S15
VQRIEIFSFIKPWPAMEKIVRLVCLLLALAASSAFVVCSTSKKVVSKFPSLKMADSYSAVSASDVLADLEELDSMVGDDIEEPSEPKQAALNRLAIKSAIQKYARHERDGGSPEVQIAIATEKILYMTTHLKAHPHDFHSTRGLRRMVEWRKTQLNFLHDKNPTRALEIVSALGIRFTPKAKFETRESKYMAYTNTKNVKALEQIKSKKQFSMAK